MPADPKLQKLYDTFRSYNVANAQSLLETLPPEVQDMVEKLREASEDALAAADGNRAWMETQRETLNELIGILAHNERMKAIHGTNDSMERTLDSNRRAITNQKAKIEKRRAATGGTKAKLTIEIIEKAVTIWLANRDGVPKTFANDPLPAIPKYANRDACQAGIDELLAKKETLDRETEANEAASCTFEESRERMLSDVALAANKNDPVRLGPIIKPTRSADGVSRLGHINLDIPASALLLGIPELRALVEESLLKQLKARSWKNGISAAKRDSNVERIEAAQFALCRALEAHYRFFERAYKTRIDRPAWLHPLAYLAAKVVDAPPKAATKSKGNQFETEQKLRPAELIHAAARDAASGLSPIREEAIGKIDQGIANAKANADQW